MVLDVIWGLDAPLILDRYQICHITLPRSALAWFSHYSENSYKRSNRINADLSGCSVQEPLGLLSGCK